MTAMTQMFNSAYAALAAGEIKYEASGGDTVKMALFASAPALTASTYSAISSGELASGSGYTTGGATLTSLTVTQTAANSWGTAWSATAWGAGSVCIPATPNGYLYFTPNGGTSTGTHPTFPTVIGETVTDSGGVIWECAGTSITAFSSANPSWSSATFTANYGAIYDSTTGYLLFLVTFGSSLSPSSGTGTVDVTSPYGWYVLFC